MSNNITPVCGFKDSEGRFWETEELASESNYKREITDLIEPIVKKIRSQQRPHIKYYPWGDPYETYDPITFCEGFSTYFTKAVLSEPNLFLSLIWKIVKHDFKQKMKNA